MATVFPRNTESLGKGLLVLNPGHIDPGFEGPISIKAINLRKDPLSIQRGQKILTIIFEEMPNSTTSPYKKNQTREEREKDLNDTLVQQDTYYLSEIVAKGADSLYFTKQEIEDKMLNLRSSLATQNEVRAIIIAVFIRLKYNLNVPSCPLLPAPCSLLPAPCLGLCTSPKRELLYKSLGNLVVSYIHIYCSRGWCYCCCNQYATKI